MRAIKLNVITTLGLSGIFGITNVSSVTCLANSVAEEEIVGIYNVYAIINGSVKCGPQTISMNIKENARDDFRFISDNPFLKIDFTGNGLPPYDYKGETLDWCFSSENQELFFRNPSYIGECNYSTSGGFIRNMDDYSAISVIISDNEVTEIKVNPTFILDESVNWSLNVDAFSNGDSLGIGASIYHEEWDVNLKYHDSYHVVCSNVITSMKLIKQQASVIGIMDPEVEPSLYNLWGRKVTNPSRGIYIKNGKKVIL